MRRDVHFGKVLANVDPGGGLVVQVDALEDGAPLGGGEPIPPSFPFAGAGEGFFFVPDVGTLVEVEVEADEERGVETLSARWRAVLYTSLDAVPAEFLTAPGKRGGIKYGDGVLLFDKLTDRLALISANVRLGEELATHPVLRGDTFNGELDTYLTAENAHEIAEGAFWTAMNTQLTTWSGLPPGPATTVQLKAFADAVLIPIAALTTPTWGNAINAFKAALTSWLSSKVKTE